MNTVHLLGANKSYDKNEQTVSINQVVVLEGYSGGSYVVYNITRNQRGITYQLIDLRTYEFRTSNLIRPLSEKFGIGIYYNDKEPKFLEPEETADLLTKATGKKDDENKAAAIRKEENDRLMKIGADRLRNLIPEGAKAIIIGRLQQDESEHQTDYYAFSTSRTVLLGFSTHQRNIFSEMRKFAGNFEGTEYLTEQNEDHEHRETWSMGHGYYLGANKYRGWIIEKHPFNDPEHIIQNYGMTAANEDNICLKAPRKQAQQQEGVTVDTGIELSTIKIEIVEYSEKSIAVFGDTKSIKDQLKELRGLFSGKLTHNGVKSAGWIFSKKQESTVRKALAQCNINE